MNLNVKVICVTLELNITFIGLMLTLLLRIVFDKALEI